MNLTFCKRRSFLLHLNWGAGFPGALHCIMPVLPLMNSCSLLVWSNLATEVNWINAIHYMCNNWSIFFSRHMKTSASLAKVRYYKVMLHTDLVEGFVYRWEHSHSTNVDWLRFRPRLCYEGPRILVLESGLRGFSQGSAVFSSHQNFIDLWLRLTFSFLNE